MYEPRNESESVTHLVELGYVDPDVEIARKAALRRQLEADFQQAARAYQQNDLDGAQRALKTLVADDPDWVAPRQLLAEIYYRKGEHAKAKSQLDWLTLHAVEHPRLALIAGAIALANRDFVAALSALQYAAHVEPTLPSVHTQVGTALRRTGRAQEAQQAFETAVAGNPADAHALDGLAAIYVQQQDFAAAANAALEALDQDIQLYSAHYRLGVSLAYLGRPNEAVTALETAARLKPDAAAPYYWLVRVAGQQLGDPERAALCRDRGRDIIRKRRASH